MRAETNGKKGNCGEEGNDLWGRKGGDQGSRRVCRGRGLEPSEEVFATKKRPRESQGM